MEIKEFIGLLEKKNFSLTVDGTRLILKTNRTKLNDTEINEVKNDPAVINYIRSNKEAIIEYINKSKELSNNVVSIYRLSGLQAGMLFHNLYDQDGGSYRNQLKCDLLNVDLDAFSKSWQYLLDQHTILRSSFYDDAFKIPVQCVYRNIEIPIEIIDFSGLAGEEQAAAVYAYEEEDSKKGFDFTVAPLMRVILLRLDDVRYRMLWTSHHILIDGWSTPILMEEFLKTYQSLIAAETIVPAEEDRYEDYIRYVEAQDKEKEEAYWRGYLGSLEIATLLPFIASNSRRNEGTGDFKEERLSMPASFTEKAEAFARRNYITVNTLMQGVWASMLHQYTGQQDIAFGVVVSGRPDDLPGVEKRVGLYINTLPLCSHMEQNCTIEVWLKELQHEQQQSRNYQYASLSDIQKWSPVRGELFDSIMVFQNFPLSKVVADQEHFLKIENLVTQEQTSNYPMLVRIAVDNDISIQFIYKEKFINNDAVQKIKYHFQRTLEQIVLGEAVYSSEINLLTAEEGKRLQFFNNTAVPYLAHETIISLFEERVRLSGTAVAVTYGEQCVSYSELNERANQLAHYLCEKGVRNDMLVPLLFNRSVDMVIAILAVLKSGGAYVPVDPTFPAERINYILKDTAAGIVLSNLSLSGLIEIGDVCNINILADAALIAACPVSNLRTLPEANNLAYVIYTSGSTGSPKGVCVEHRNIVNYLVHQSAVFGINEEDNILQFTNYCFDPSVEQIFIALLNGAKLVGVPDEVRMSKNLFEEFLDTHEITHLHATPSFLNNIAVRQYKRLKRVVSGGEPCQVSLANSWSKIYHFYNKYGPTEASISITQSCVNDLIEVEPLVWSVPIGKPVSNTILYVVDKQGRLLPVGVPGELWVGGAQVARGYLNQEALTAEKFIADPFAGIKGGRVYKTGDTVKWLSDGNIEFTGRIDEQIKIRGYRIEPGEIEVVLQKAPGVKEAVVAVNEDQLGNKRLIGYVVADTGFDAAPIQEYLKQRLPEYMLPAFIIEITKLPVTVNGKINKKLLPLPDPSINVSQYVAPRTEMEKHLAEIWQELLLLQQVGVQDNFFELGGDSIISIQLVSRARKLGYELQVNDIFTYQTINRIAHAIKERKGAVHNINEQGILNGESGLLPVQRRYFEEGYADKVTYNQSMLLSLSKKISANRLAQIFKLIIAQHDSLRFFYTPAANGTWTQHYGREENNIQETDLSTAENIFSAQAIENSCNACRQSLNIEDGNLFKVLFIKTPASETHNRIFIIAHHLVIDGISWRILLQDVETLLSAVINNLSLTLGEKGSSYRQWYQMLEKYASGKKMSSQEGYWKYIMQSYQPLNEWSKGNRIAAAKTGKYVTTMNEVMTNQLLQETSVVYHTETNDILMAALAQTLCTWTDSENIVIGMESHGRENIDLAVDVSRTVGWFTSIYPHRLYYKNGLATADLLKITKEDLRRVPDKGIGYGILNYMLHDGPVARHWDVLVNNLGRIDNVIQKSEWLTPAPESTGESALTGYQSDHLLNITLFINKELVVQWEYNDGYFSESAIEKMAANFMTVLSGMIEHCIAQKKNGVSEHTPADFGLSNDISYNEMDSFLKETFVNGEQRADFLEDCYRLSGLQEGMLFHHLYDKSGVTYRNQLKCDLLNVDLDAFYKSWQYIIQRHSILRTGFCHNIFKVPVQCVYRHVEMPVEILDFRYADAGKQAIALAEFEQSDYKKGFDFSVAPLMRVSLLRIDNSRYRMFWTSQHILMDGWSIPILMEEFLNLYESLLTGRSVMITDGETDQYKDYIHYLNSQDKDKEEAYWRHYLRRLETSTMLPFIISAAKRNTGEGSYREETFILDASFTEYIDVFARRCHITVNTLMQAVWTYLLHQYTGQEDIAFGVVVSGRPEEMPDVEKRVGLYINTLPLCSHLDENNDIKGWLQQLQLEQQQSRTFQYSSLSDIKKWSSVRGELFDSMMVFQNYPVSEVIAAHQWALQVENIDIKEQANFPFYITISVAEQIKISFSYNESILDGNYVKQIKRHFEEVLIKLTSDENQTLETIHLLDQSATNELINEYAGKEFSYPLYNNVTELFEEQAKKLPDNTALIFEGQLLTYKDLNERANKLAHYLREKGVGSETLVPVCMNRSLEMIISIIGILKSGGAFVPIDPLNPAERISYMLKDTKADLVLSNGVCLSLEAATENKDVEILDLKIQWPFIEEMNSENLLQINNSEQLAYIIYTSGSTGNPKGVLIEQQSLINYLLTCKSHYIETGDNQGWGSYMHLSYTFDASLTAMFIPLITGKPVVIADAHASAAEVFELPAFKKYGPYDFIKLTPAHLPMLEEVAKGSLEMYTRCVVIGGDALVSSDIQWIAQSDNVHVINEYGPTEATVACTLYAVDLNLLTESKTAIPIGKPLSNNHIFITDRKGRLVAPGVPGQLCIAGIQVARGYLNLLELTASRFLENPFGKGKFYQTGDVARWLPDGCIEYLGRVDEQVKIRGYRIELGEIEKIIADVNAVKDVKVLLYKKDEYSSELRAYVQVEQEQDSLSFIDQIQSRLIKSLPVYMHPAHIFLVDKYPLTTNNKIDKKALFEIPVNGIISDDHSRPPTETEKQLIEIWKKLLELDHISVSDNFFQIGGDSLLAVRLISIIRKQMDVEISISSFFDLSTIERTARYIKLNISEERETQYDTIKL